MSIRFLVFSVLITAALFAGWIESSGKRSFATTTGIGPDKWASVWLIEKTEGLGSVYVVEDLQVDLELVTAFDIPGALYNRSGSHTTYSTLQTELAPGDPVVAALAKIIHEIEIDAWYHGMSLESQIVEQSFRKMQLLFSRDLVSKSCYLKFFDNVAGTIESHTLTDTHPEALIPDRRCMGTAQSPESREPFDLTVPVLQLHAALPQQLRSDQSVLFVDTRETWEFNEGHIPGAINIKLREIEESLDRVRDADLVIAYCVKDFRGYEAARSFRRHGIDAAIMTPHGMRGWIDEGLPIAGTRGMPEEEALTALRAMAEDVVSSVQ